MTKMLVSLNLVFSMVLPDLIFAHRVANVLSSTSRTCTISKPPKCLFAFCVNDGLAEDIRKSRTHFTVHDDTRPSHVTTSSNHHNVSWLKFDVLHNLVLDKVKLDRVVDFDSRVGVSDGSSIVSENVRDSLGSELVSSDFAEFEVGLFGGDSVDGETTFDVVEESEVLAGSLNGDDICRLCSAKYDNLEKQSSRTHEASRVSIIGPDLPVDFDQSLLDDSSDFSPVQSVLEPVTEKDDEGKTFTKLVRTGRWSGRLHPMSTLPAFLVSPCPTHIGPSQLVQHP